MWLMPLARFCNSFCPNGEFRYEATYSAEYFGKKSHGDDIFTYQRSVVLFVDEGAFELRVPGWSAPRSPA